MVKVEGGRFMMAATREQGSDARSDEKPAHKVKLSDYYIGQVPVTQELWQAVIGKNPSNFKGQKNPVENVSWIDCNEFIEKLNKQTMNKRPAGMEFRLPSEAEWEFAARGGSNRNGVNYKYSGSNNLGEVAWYNRNSSNKTQPVGRMKPNQLGIYDMSGNVWEWCRDGMREYKSCNQINPYGLNYSDYHRRVLRGGGWYFDASRCRVSSRREDDTSNSFSHYGLRLCLVKVL